MFKLRFCVPIFVFLLLIAAIDESCTPSAGPSETNVVNTEPAISLSSKKAPPETEWDRVVINAKKEGIVVLYGATGISQSRAAFVKAMKEKFGITLDVTVASGSELTAKLVNERKAGLYLPDVYMGGTQSMALALIPMKMLEPIEPNLILPEVKDPSLWFLGKLPIWDTDRQVLASLANISSFSAYNTNLVKAEELRSFRDLLKPKFKGQIIMSDPTQPGSNWFQSAYLIMGTDFLKEFLNQDIVLTRDIRLITESLAKGKFSIGIAANEGGIKAAARDGAPVSIIPTFKEGTVVVVGAGNVAVMNNHPHPNAAKLFVNWVLSKEGQTVLSKANAQASRRVDVPTDHLDPWMVPDAEMKYLWETDESYMKASERNFELAKELFGPLLK